MSLSRNPSQKTRECDTIPPTRDRVTYRLGEAKLLGRMEEKMTKNTEPNTGEDTKKKLKRKRTSGCGGYKKRRGWE